MQRSKLNTYAHRLAVWALAGLGLLLPISPLGANIMTMLLLIGWLGSGDWSAKWTRLRQSPAAHGASLFLALVVIGLCYGDPGANGHYLTKYASLLLLPVILSLELSNVDKQRALTAFCVAMLITLLCSILIWTSLIPAGLFSNSSPDNPTVFKLHITQGFFMVLAAFFMYVAAMRLPADKQRWLLLALALLAVANALVMIKGRTGQAVLAVLLIYLFHLRFPRYGVLLGLLASIVLATGAYGLSPAFQERADIAVTEMRQWQDKRGDPSSSIGTRLDYYYTTAAIIKEHPLLGVGTGGFIKAYEEQIAGTPLQSSNNPHNQYLLVSAQYGLIGLLALLFFYFSIWKQARLIDEPWHRLACGLLLAYLVGNLFNSFMLDLSERLMFAWGMGILLTSQELRLPTQTACPQ